MAVYLEHTRKLCPDQRLLQEVPEGKPPKTSWDCVFPKRLPAWAAEEACWPKPPKVDLLPKREGAEAGWDAPKRLGLLKLKAELDAPNRPTSVWKTLTSLPLQDLFEFLPRALRIAI